MLQLELYSLILRHELILDIQINDFNNLTWSFWTHKYSELVVVHVQLAACSLDFQTHEHNDPTKTPNT